MHSRAERFKLQASSVNLKLHATSWLKRKTHQQAQITSQENTTHEHETRNE
jgi:hypothetical protein